MLQRVQVLLLLTAMGAASCSDSQRSSVPGQPEAWKSAAPVRAERRAYDGAPPVIPHPALGPPCASCHTQQGLFAPGYGYAPASPHDQTPGIGPQSWCRQCHVFQSSQEEFRASGFQGLEQDLGAGPRAYSGAPPVTPHRYFMREDCLSCHAGPGVREGIRTSHPERTRCRQCHLNARSSGLFQNQFAPERSEAAR